MVKRQSFALVSEDTELGRWALTRALEAEGFEVQAVSTWVEASAWLRRARFSLAVVAVSSAAGNAADIVAYVSNHHPNTHLVLLADDDTVGELRLADILAKPLDLADVAHLARSRCGAGDDTLEA
ncbi:MAG: hypothetical protein MUE61_15380 [Vicinamibacterales bacterium]|nr:hypothetical protein [Vicinamibacterales bacterium]